MTNQFKTKEIIDGYRMDNNNINVEYFTEQITLFAMNTEELYNNMKNTRIKPESVAKNWICSFINFMLKCNGYNGYICTYTQVRNELANQLEEIENNVTDYVIAEREEYYTE